MVFPNQDFANWILTFPDDKLSKVFRSIETPLRAINASFKVRRLCLEQLTLQCKVLLERIPEDLIKKYRKERREETCGSDLWKQKVIEEKRKLNRILQNTKVLKKTKSRVSSVQRRRLLGILIRKNMSQAKMISQRLRSKGGIKENNNEKNRKTQIAKCSSDIKNSKAELRKRLNDCIKSENALSSEDLIKQKCGSLKTKMNKSSIKDTGQERVSRKIMCTSVAESNESGVCHKSSHILNQTIEMPHEEMQPRVQNVPEENVPVRQSLSKQKYMEAAPSYKESCKHKYTKSVHIDGKSVHSPSRHECAPLKISRVCKPQDCCYSVKNKSDNIITIRKEIKTELKSSGGHDEKSRGSALCDNKHHKRGKHRSLDKQSSEKTCLHMSKTRKTVTSMQSDAEQKVKESHKHKSRHEDNHLQGNSDCKSKHGSGMSHHSSNKSRSHEQKSSSEIRKSSSHTNKPENTKNTSENRSSSHQAERKHKTNTKETDDKSCTNRLEETRFKSSEGMKHHISSKEVNSRSSDTVKKRGYKNVHHTKSVPHSNETTEPRCKATTAGAAENLPCSLLTRRIDCYDANGNLYAVQLLGQDNSTRLFENVQFILAPSDHKQKLGELNDKQSSISSITGDLNQLKQQSVVTTEPCSTLEDASQGLAGIHASKNSFEGNNGKNKKRPLNTQSLGSHGQVKIKKISHSNNTEKHYNLESVQQQPVLLSMPLLNDDVSPSETSNLNQGCISHFQPSVGQSVNENKLSDCTAKKVGSHQLPIDNIPVQNRDTMMPLLDATMCKSQNRKSSEVPYHDNNLCTREQEKDLLHASNTLYKHNNDQNSGVLNNEPDAGNIRLANEITPSTSENVISGTANISVQMEMQNFVKQEVQVITELKQEDKSWLRAYIGNYSTRSDRNVLKDPDIIIIEDDDDDDFKIINSHMAPIPKKNKGAGFSDRFTVEPEITVVYSCIGDRMYDNNKPYCHVTYDTTIQQDEFNSFCNENVSLEGVISLNNFDGNEFVSIENSNYENVSMQHSISVKETAPFKIKHIMNYFRNTLKGRRNDVMVQDEKIIVAGRYKTIVSCLVFMYYNYQYFFHTISNDIMQLAQILHMKLHNIQLGELMEINASKLEEGDLKANEMKNVQSFLKRNIEKGAPPFAKVFNNIMQKFKDFRSLPPFYQTLFSLILFQRIVHNLRSLDSDNVQKHFLGIRFIIKALLYNGNGDTQMISLLTEKSDADFVTDFNTVTRSIRLIQSAVLHHCSGEIPSRNRRVCDMLIHLTDTSSSSFFDNSGADNGVRALLFPQSPSVSSTQLNVNDANRSPLMTDSKTLNADNNKITSLKDSFQPSHSAPEVMNNSPDSLHQLQRVVLPRSSIVANHRSEKQNSDIQQKCANEAAYSNLHSFPGSQGTLDNTVNLVLNSRNSGDTVYESSNTNLGLGSSHESVGRENNCGSISTSQMCRPPVAHNRLRSMPGNEGTLGSLNPAWNAQESELQNNNGGLISTNQVGRPPVTHNNGLHYMMPGNEGALSSQNPAWNTLNLNNLQRKLSGLHETEGPCNNCGLIYKHQVCRQQQPHSVTHSGLNYTSEIHNVGNILNSTMYRPVQQPAADTTSDSDFRVAEQHKSTQLSNPTGPKYFPAAANKNSSMVNPSFRHHSSSSSAFHPPNIEYTGVPQVGNQNVHRRLQEVANSVENYNNAHSTGSGTSSNQCDTSLLRRVQRIDPTSQYVFSNSGEGQTEQRPLPLVAKPPPLYYNTTTLMLHRQGMYLPPPQNINASNVSMPSHGTSSLLSNRSQPFAR